MFEVGYLTMVEAEGIALAVFRWLYQRRKPNALEEKKPRWKRIPKYEVPVNVPPEMLRPKIAQIQP